MCKAQKNYESLTTNSLMNCLQITPPDLGRELLLSDSFFLSGRVYQRLVWLKLRYLLVSIEVSEMSHCGR